MITINGKTYTGNSISIIDGVIKIDGKMECAQDLCKNLQIIIHGDVGVLQTDGSATVKGSTSSIRAGGSVQCGSVTGDVQAGGSVTCGKVEGKIMAGGSVTTS